ncbi:FAD dependent oxidoreductase [Curtobacterium sp. UNCCL20]|uniref:FAD-dependent oxidoreductase n=1 Tax=Curtobacterium sp. UNCCL20 TaxID=1502773 RepID=UPI00088484D4|nr:FAD-dependent oxidoreductase [Curtobacterium sp. UNCCL20]SDQ21898.1 FAD dependent oxidoreductase [Curtobacterium sp. UNCCL20]
MQSREQHHDVVVVGGGLAGVSAAVAAARLGSSVALVTNRPVLGGNSSSEVRVWVVGATAHGTQRFARETGIMGELFLENQYRNPQGNAVYWDQVVLDLVRAEPNVHLHLNTDVRTVTTTDGDGPTRITSVTGWTMGSEIETTFTAPVFLDCTGDGLVGALAGASYRIGREGRDEHGEEWAPAEPDDELLGSSIFFSTHDTGRPEKFVPPSIAIDLATTPILANRAITTGDNGCNYWWIEWGGELDTVSDNERIRDELWGVVYGIWDHIKNSGAFDADTLTLDWVGAIPGKREYRRFVGDHTLTQQDLLEQRTFPDTVAFGGWSIDLHPVEGVYAETAGAQQRYTDGTYDIPFRSLYSADVANLLFAGRNISASHVAFGSTRVMATCSALGQAAGTAAHLVARHGTTPRELGTAHVAMLQQTLLREDAPLIGVRAVDGADLARRARISASSELTALDTTPWATDDVFVLDRDVALVLPVDPALGELRLRTVADHATEVTVELWTTGKPQNAVPIDRVSTHRAAVPAGLGEAVVDLAFRPDVPGNAVVVVRRTAGVRLVLTDGHPYGVLALRARAADDAQFDDHIPEEADQPVTDWEARALRGRSFAFTAAGSSDAWRASRVVDGYQRPFGGPHMWSSEAGGGSAVLRLDWAEPVDVRQVRIVWNDDVDADLINLHHHRTHWDAVPTLTRDYRLEACVDGDWRVLETVTDNRHRHRVHDVAPVRTASLRVVVTATNGSPFVTASAVKVF